MIVSWLCTHERHSTPALQGYSKYICDKHQVHSGAAHKNWNTSNRKGKLQVRKRRSRNKNSSLYSAGPPMYFI